MYISGKLLLII